jgi:SAM-dependent methyltransferase
MTSRTAPARVGVRSVALTGYRQWRLFIEPERLRMRKAVRIWIRQCAPGSRVLEVGGGTSFLQPVIEREVPGAHYVSGDIAPTNNTTVVLDATALPMADASVDAVLALEVLEHMPQPERMLGEVARVLRVDGMAILTVPFMFGVHDFRDYFRFTPLGFSTLLERHGLELADIRQRGGTFVAATGLVRTLILNAIVGEPKDWRARGIRKKLLWMVATVVLTPWTLITYTAMGLDGLFDQESKSPPGYFFLCRKSVFRSDSQ